MVHEDHGVARFAGTTSMDSNGESREYLVLEYAESDKLYLPTDHLDRIFPYVGTSDLPPTLTRLSSSEWARAKERVKASTRELARSFLTSTPTGGWPGVTPSQPTWYGSGKWRTPFLTRNSRPGPGN